MHDRIKDVGTTEGKIMTGEGAQGVNVVLPGKGEEVTIPGFGATYKLYGRDTGGEVSIVEHPFAVGIITAPTGTPGRTSTPLSSKGK